MRATSVSIWRSARREKHGHTHMHDGTPSTIAPTPLQWLSPKVVTRKMVPNVDILGANFHEAHGVWRDRVRRQRSHVRKV